MKNLILCLMLFASISFTACTQNNEHDHSSTQIELNEGEKWEVVPEMMGYIQQIEKDITSFEGANLAEHQALAQRISTNLNQLTSNCTMKGQAHDELHKWLVPFLDLANEYEHASDSVAAIKKLDEIKISFNTFNTYFQ